MGEFLQNNWFWLLLLGFFIWMHGSGMGCCGHGGHRHKGDNEDKNQAEHTGRRH